MANSKGPSARFGNIRRLPPGRFQARYTGPDGNHPQAPTTFDTERRRRGLAVDRPRRHRRATPGPPTAARPTARRSRSASYAERWLAARTLEPRTREHYRTLLDQQILPDVRHVPLRHITPDLVRDWHATTARPPDAPGHAYGLLRTILGRRHRRARSAPTRATSAAPATSSACTRSSRPP